MPKVKAECSMVRLIREYPTEWTWYSADEQDDEQQQQREEDRDIEGEPVTAKPNYLADHLA